MAIPPESVTLLRAGIESAPEWKEAWGRVNDYLHALSMPEDLDREQLLYASFRRAVVRRRREPFVPAIQLAFEEVQRGLDRAFGHLVAEDTPGEWRLQEERIRMYLTEADAPGSFYRSQSVPEEVLEALRQVKLEASPMLQRASITPKPFELSEFGERMRHLAERIASVTNHRAVVWILGFLALALLFFASL
jgi:hypothetical protein